MPSCASQFDHINTIPAIFSCQLRFSRYTAAQSRMRLFNSGCLTTYSSLSLNDIFKITMFVGTKQVLILQSTDKHSNVQQCTCVQPDLTVITKWINCMNFYDLKKYTIIRKINTEAPPQTPPLNLALTRKPIVLKNTNNFVQIAT